MNMLRLHAPSLVVALVLLVIEVLIASFVHDDFVRPYGGDVLVIPLIFFTVNGLVRVRPLILALAVLLFAFTIEATQALGLLHGPGLVNNAFARALLGDTFQWGDLICYAAGTLASVVAVGPIERMHRP